MLLQRNGPRVAQSAKSTIHRALSPTNRLRHGGRRATRLILLVLLTIYLALVASVVWYIRTKDKQLLSAKEGGEKKDDAIHPKGWLRWNFTSMFAQPQSKAGTLPSQAQRTRWGMPSKVESWVQSAARARDKRAEDLRLTQAFLKNQNVSEMRETIREVRSKFDNETVVTIRGFFSSGTNWLRSLLSANCPKVKFSFSLTHPWPRWTSIDADGLYGWKHGYFLQKEIDSFRESANHSMIIISREAPTWLVSSWKMNAMVPIPSWYKPPPPRRYPSFASSKGDPKTNGRGIINAVVSLFVSPSQTTSIHQPPQFVNLTDYIFSHQVNESGVPPGPVLEKYYDPEVRPLYRLEASYPLEARTKVYRNWIQLSGDGSISKKIRFIRYEDLLDEPYRMMVQLTRELHLPCNFTNEQTFNRVTSRVKMGMSDRASRPQEKHPRSEFCSLVTSQELYEAIMARIDKTFERDSLGYNYPNQREEYCPVTES